MSVISKIQRRTQKRANVVLLLSSHRMYCAGQTVAKLSILPDALFIPRLLTKGDPSTAAPEWLSGNLILTGCRSEHVSIIMMSLPPSPRWYMTGFCFQTLWSNAPGQFSVQLLQTRPLLHQAVMSKQTRSIDKYPAALATFNWNNNVQVKPMMKLF